MKIKPPSSILMTVMKSFWVRRELLGSETNEGRTLPRMKHILREKECDSERGREREREKEGGGDRRREHNYTK